jgi:hypothetical protein
MTVHRPTDVFDQQDSAFIACDTEEPCRLRCSSGPKLLPFRGNAACAETTTEPIG